MRELELDIRSFEEAQRYIDQSEWEFRRDLNGALETIFTGGQVPKVIALSGPTCSGKTTTASRLVERITEAGGNAVVMSIDEFFHDRDDRNVVEGESPDYDSVNAIDLDYFSYFMKRLMAGKSVLVPKFDFTAASRVGYEEYIPGSRDIYVFEGIQAVYPEVTELFEGVSRTIFSCVPADVRYGDTLLTKHDIRLLRRLVRDFKYRGATAEFTLHLWVGVRDNEEKNIFPNAQHCDVYIDSFLEYEPFLIARHALPILETVPADSRYCAQAEELIGKLRAFDCPYFEDRMIPDNSVFHEFIG